VAVASHKGGPPGKDSAAASAAGAELGKVWWKDSPAASAAGAELGDVLSWTHKGGPPGKDSAAASAAGAELGKVWWKDPPREVSQQGAQSREGGHSPELNGTSPGKTHHPAAAGRAAGLAPPGGAPPGGAPPAVAGPPRSGEGGPARRARMRRGRVDQRAGGTNAPRRRTRRLAENVEALAQRRADTRPVDALQRDEGHTPASVGVVPPETVPSGLESTTGCGAAGADGVIAAAVPEACRRRLGTADERPIVPRRRAVAEVIPRSDGAVVGDGRAPLRPRGVRGLREEVVHCKGPSWDDDARVPLHAVRVGARDAHEERLRRGPDALARLAAGWANHQSIRNHQDMPRDIGSLCVL
jgi:hypothetical protein